MFDFDPKRWLDLAAHYPDLIALVIGSLVGYVFTMMIELYFLPVVTEPSAVRQQKGLTFIICWLASTFCSTVLWRYMDSADPFAMRFAVSAIVSVLSFAAYPLIARIGTALLAKFGVDLGSAWSTKQ